MPQQLSNNARSTLVSTINDTATSLTIQSGAADLFPVADVGSGSLPSVDDWFKATLQDVSGHVEIIYVRTRNSGSAVFSNVLRGQEGTTARSFVAGAIVGLRVTAADIQGVIDLPGSNNTFVGDNTFTQPVTGDLVGDVTGNVTGDVTGEHLSGSINSAVTATTQTAGTNTTQVSTTAFVKTAIDNYDSALTVSTGQIEDDAVTTAKIAPTGVTAGTYGSATEIPSIAVNSEGQVTSATTNTITIADPIGVGQTWQAVSRAVNTNYTNDTGRPIQVMAGIYSSYGVYSSAVVGGVTMGQGYLYSCCGVGVNFDMPYSFIVPAGATYRINGTAVRNWAELR